ncbi:MAG: hypothetical protein ACT4QA_18330 [Panacagrimonas sp.]
MDIEVQGFESETALTGGIQMSLYLGGQGPKGDAGGIVGELTLTAGAAVNGHRAVASLADGRAVHYNPADTTHHDSVIGVALNAALVDQSLTVQASGFLSFGGWSWTPGLPIFASADGLLTQTVPAAVAVQLAAAINATTVFVRPQRPIFLT